MSNNLKLVRVEIHSKVIFTNFCFKIFYFLSFSNPNNFIFFQIFLILIFKIDLQIQRQTK